MRRRRKPLEVSTFPFLAVLLCAMGSLILVLLVMDRKAKMGARAKAQAAYASEVAKVGAEAAKAEAAHRAELDRHLQEMRAEWEKKRDALHSKLLTEQQTLQLEMQQLREKMILAAARLRAEQDQTGELKKQVEAGNGKLQGEAKALMASRAALQDTEKHTEQEREALARMSNDLVVLEQALRDLKAAREREKQTYSVVPYRGKRGENRRPLYVECTGPSVIFHPDKKSLLVTVQRGEVRAEVEQRIARQHARLAATPTIDQTPYLMLLVRPNGILSYYAFQEALAGLNVQFGYELIDPDWLLDFPPDDEQPTIQPWQLQAKQPEIAPSEAAKPGAPVVHGVTMGGQNGVLPPLGSSPPSTAAYPARKPGLPGTGYGSPGRADGNASAAVGLGAPVAQGSERRPGGGSTGGGPGGSAVGDTKPGFAPVVRGVRPGYGGDAIANGAPSDGVPTLPNQRPQGGGPPATGAPPWATGNGPGNPGGAAPNGAPPPTALAQANGPVGGPAGPWSNGNNGGNAIGGQVDPSTILPPVVPPQGQGSAPGTPPSNPLPTNVGGPANAMQPNGTQATASPPPGGQVPPAVRTTVVPGTPRRPGDPPGDPSSDGEPASGGLPPLPPTGIEPKRPRPPLRAARLSGDRDYLIFIECKPEGVILYPAQKYYSMASLLNSSNNPLVQDVQLMIQRRQASVRPGEVAYRPELRFLVRPETLRAYHAAYPLFNGMALTQTRQNLIPEDDVLSILAGQR